MGKRFYIGKKDVTEDSEDLEVWIDSKIPPPPDGQVCECDKDKHAHENFVGEIVDCSDLGDTYLYVIKDGHVCYSYMCFGCAETQSSDGYLGDVDYPATEAGYAVAPRHCA